MPSLGEVLRRERTTKGIQLERIAAETRINLRYLEALETDDWKSLPGVAFARSFARQYARFIGLEEERIEGELARIAAEEAAPPAESMQPMRGGSGLAPIPGVVGLKHAPSRSLLTPALALALALTLCTGIYVIWLRPRTPAVSTSQSPARRPAETSTTTSPGPVVRDTPEPVASPIRASPAIAAPALSSAATSKPPTPEPKPEAGGPFTVELAARADVWISISADGKTVFADVLKAGRSQRVDASQQARLRVGDAASLEVSWNGNPVGKLGPKGHVRTVLFTPSGHEIVPPAPRVRTETKPDPPPR